MADEKKIYQHHERNTTAGAINDVQERELVFASDINYMIFKDAGGTARYILTGSASGNVILKDGSINMEGAWICEDFLTLNVPTQGYSFKGVGTALALESQDTATGFNIHLMTKDGDGTDNVNINIFGVGTVDDIANRERLQIKYEQGNQEFQISSDADGTGTLRNIVLYTEGNVDQLKLHTNGNVSLSEDLFLPDDKKIQFGDDEDAHIMWDTSGVDDLLISSTTSIRMNASTNITLNPATFAYLQVNSSNAIKLDSTYVTVYKDIIIDSGTINSFLYTNATKGVTYVSGTGTGNVVRSASPTLTGTINGAAASFSGNISAVDATFTGLIRGATLALSGRYDAGDGGTSGAYESIDINGIDMVFVNPTGSSSSYYYLTDGTFQGQRVSVTNDDTDGVAATINMSGSSTGSGSNISINGAAYEGVIFKWDVTNDRWYAFKGN